MTGRDDDPREAGGVELAFLLIEIPRTVLLRHQPALEAVGKLGHRALQMRHLLIEIGAQPGEFVGVAEFGRRDDLVMLFGETDIVEIGHVGRSEEHTSELQSLMRISYAVFCLKKKNKTQ